jgi:hypothetical protein
MGNKSNARIIDEYAEAFFGEEFLEENTTTFQTKLLLTHRRCASSEETETLALSQSEGRNARILRDWLPAQDMTVTSFASIPGRSPAAPSSGSVADEPSPAKRVKREWEGPPGSALKNNLETVKNDSSKMEEDVSLELMAAGGESQGMLSNGPDLNVSLYESHLLWPRTQSTMGTHLPKADDNEPDLPQSNAGVERGGRFLAISRNPSPTGPSGSILPSLRVTHTIDPDHVPAKSEAVDERSLSLPTYLHREGTTLSPSPAQLSRFRTSVETRTMPVMGDSRKHMKSRNNIRDEIREYTFFGEELLEQSTTNPPTSPSFTQHWDESNEPQILGNVTLPQPEGGNKRKSRDWLPFQQMSTSSIALIPGEGPVASGSRFVADMPPPAKRVRREWEGPPGDTLERDEEAVETAKTEPDDTVSLHQMTEFFSTTAGGEASEAPEWLMPFTLNGPSLFESGYEANEYRAGFLSSGMGKEGCAMQPPLEFSPSWTRSCDDTWSDASTPDLSSRSSSRAASVLSEYENPILCATDPLSPKVEDSEASMPRSSPLSAQISRLKAGGGVGARRKREMLFSCQVPGCGRSFTARVNLQYHMNSHNNTRNKICFACGASFHTAAVLRRHSKRCSGIRSPHTLDN